MGFIGLNEQALSIFFPVTNSLNYYYSLVKCPFIKHFNDQNIRT